MQKSKIKRAEHPFFFFSNEEKKQIIIAIQEAEQKTSGEIRVHLEKRAKGDIQEHAKQEFKRLGMTATQEHNGVLIFLCTASRRFAVIGDIAIHEKVSDTFWQEIAQAMESSFSEDRFAEGVVDCVQKIGEKLKEYFPYQRDDLNELPDAISYSL